jgi:hypothetical protein
MLTYRKLLSPESLLYRQWYWKGRMATEQCRMKRFKVWRTLTGRKQLSGKIINTKSL